MRSMGIGIATGVAIWFGSALAAEAQQLTPTGPLSVTAGAGSSTFTADVYLPVPSPYRLRLWVKRAGVDIHYSETVYPNPGTNNSTCTKIAQHCPVNAGDVLDYVCKIKVGSVWYDQSAPWQVTVSGTRPSTKPSSAFKSTSLALRTVERDRRRE